MLKDITLNNTEIYKLALNIQQLKISEIECPISCGFYLSKNINKIMECARDIEEFRMKIMNKYGTVNDEGQIIIQDSNSVELANNELRELENIEQNIQIYTVKLEKLADLTLTLEQIDTLSFMIEEE